MKPTPLFSRARRSGWSLAQVILTAAVISIAAAGAVSATSAVGHDGNDRLAISRVQRLRSAIQALKEHQDAAPAAWAGAQTNERRYELLKDQLPLAPATLTAFMPSGYSVVLPADLAQEPLQNPTLVRSDNLSYNYVTDRFQ